MKILIDKALAFNVPNVEQVKDFTCGVAACVSLLRYCGIEIQNEAQLYSILQPTAKNGTHFKKIVKLLAAYKLDPQVHKQASEKELIESIAKNPVIALIQSPYVPTVGTNGHWVILESYDSKVKDFSVMDPWDGHDKNITKPLLSKIWFDQGTIDNTRYENLFISINPV